MFCLKINSSRKMLSNNFVSKYLVPVETQQVCCPLRLRSASSYAQRAASSSSSFSLSSSLPPQGWCGPLVDGRHACSSSSRSNTLATRSKTDCVKLFSPFGSLEKSVSHLLYLVFVRTEQFSEQCSRTMRGPKRFGQHSSLMQVFLQKSATRSAVRTISTVAR